MGDDGDWRVELGVEGLLDALHVDGHLGVVVLVLNVEGCTGCVEDEVGSKCVVFVCCRVL